jgi:hypothetical protein
MAKAEGQYCPLPKDRNDPKAVLGYKSGHAIAAWILSKVPTLEADRATRMKWQRERIERRSPPKPKSSYTLESGWS